jgi:uncharacterized damage-inducible protein DinB
MMDEIAHAPALLREAVVRLDDPQLDTPYREEGWTVRQVVHHVFDSHVNAYVRFRWALTEDAPVIKPYDEKLWARLPDAITAPVAVSLDLLDALHTRWLILLRAMTPGDFDRRWTNPGFGESNLDVLLQLYAWHGRHHVAHITSLRQREGW